MSPLPFEFRSRGFAPDGWPIFIYVSITRSCSEILNLLSPPDAARRNVPRITLGKCSVSVSHKTSLFPQLHSTIMLTASFPCMILHRRNLACIGCGCPRSAGGTAPPQHQQTYPTRTLSSPCFTSFPTPSSSLPIAPSQHTPQHTHYHVPQHAPQQPIYTYSPPQQQQHLQQQQQSTFSHTPASPPSLHTLC